MNLERNYLDLAYEIAKQVHAGQKDKGGNDYILHPQFVASTVQTIDQKIVALLHDVVEDTSITFDDLRNYGFNDNIIQAIKVLTKVEGQSYANYIDGVKKNELARIVKIADMKHNSDLGRLKTVTVSDQERANKYNKMIIYLEH
jgi:(p)ppGpp synthase/HD superfamily hydrolase